MICIAYVSTALRPPTAAELEEILTVSQRNNRAQGVTGLLCHHDGSFLQFLEGEEDDVEAVYARIADDPRHRSLIRMYRREISGRLFPAWTMALVRPDSLGPEHSQFCQGLRDVQVELSEEHAGAVTLVLNAFRAWLR